MRLPLLFLTASFLLLACSGSADQAARAKCQAEIATDSAGEPTVQVFALGFKQDLARMERYADYTALMNEALASVAPCFSKTVPNLVVFPENTALIAAFIGSRGEAARKRKDAIAAFSDLLISFEEPLSYYKKEYPDAPALRQLLLAATDPIARAIEQTFPPMARKHGIYLAIDVDVAEYATADDPALAARLRDPDLAAKEPAYLATSPEVYNVSIVYGPDGKEIGRVRKAYLTPPEEDQLRLSYGSLEQLKPIATPFGKLAPVISKDGWMPDVMERFNDLGAEITLQHEAFSGWAIDERGGDWLPDVMLQSIWWQVQAFDSIRYAVLPCITGNLLDLVFDCQSAILKEADTEDTLQAFIGQEKRAGFLDIGAWVMPDPAEEQAGLSLTERRNRLRERGDAMKPGSGSAFENGYQPSLAAGAVALMRENGVPRRKPIATLPADSMPRIGGHNDGKKDAPLLVAATQGGNAIRPDVAAQGDSIHTVWISVTRSARTVDYSRIQGGGVQAKQTLPIEGDYLYGARVTAAGSNVYVIAVDESPQGARLKGAVSHDGGSQWKTWSVTLGASEGARWQPAVAAEGDDVFLVWVDRRHGASDIYLAVSRNQGGSFAVRRLDDAHEEEHVRENPANPRNNQALPSIAVNNGAVAVVWADFRDYHWDIYGAASTDAGATWSANMRLNPEVDESKERIFGVNDVALSAARLAVVAEGVDDRGPDRYVHTLAPAEFCAYLQRSCVPAAKSSQPAYRPQAAFFADGFAMVYQTDGSIAFESEGGNYFLRAGGIRFNPRIAPGGWVWEDWAFGHGQTFFQSREQITPDPQDPLRAHP